MNRELPPGDERRKWPDPAEPLARVAAKLADAMLAGLVVQALGPLGVVLGTGYLLVADGLHEGQSLGKRLLNLRAINPETGQPVDWRQSALRNADLAVLLLLASFPLLGTVLAVVLGLFIVSVELHALYREPKGQRMGDLFARTMVVGQAWERLPETGPLEPGHTA